MDYIAEMKKMLQDTSKGLATRDELKTAVTEKNAEMLKAIEEREKLYDAAQARIAEVEAQVKQMEAQVKRLLNTNFADIKTPDGYYKGLWPTLKMAHDFGLFVIAEIAGNDSAAKELDNLGIERRREINGKILSVKDISGGSLESGAAVIPTQFMGVLPALLGRYGVFRRNAQEWPMASDSAYAAVQTSDVVVYAPGAGTAPTASAPGFKNVGLNAKKMMTLTAIDSECTEDMAIAIGEVVGRSIVRAFAKNEDKIAFLGDGTSTYFNFVGIGQSLINVDATLTNVMACVIQSVAGNWTKFAAIDFLNLVGALDGDSDDEDAKFYCHRNFYFTVMINIALGLGGTNATEVIQTGWGRNPQFLNRSVEHTSVLPNAVAAADYWPCFFGNLRQAALLGQSRAVTIDQSREAYFTTDQIGIRGTERIAINIHNVGTKKNATNPLPGAIVGLRGDIA